DQYPADGGIFEYKIITPSRFGWNAALLFNKKGVIGIDHEMVNYAEAQLSSDNVSDFSEVNSTIKRKYTVGHNVRIGGELNLNMVMIRAGYVMQGSQFGNLFAGNFVRHSLSLGIGLRP